jgi:hypothetical protein
MASLILPVFQPQQKPGFVDDFAQVFSAVFFSVPANALDYATFKEVQTVALDELHGLNAKTLVVVAADLGF